MLQNHIFVSWLWYNTYVSILYRDNVGGEKCHKYMKTWYIMITCFLSYVYVHMLSCNKEEWVYQDDFPWYAYVIFTLSNCNNGFNYL